MTMCDDPGVATGTYLRVEAILNLLNEKDVAAITGLGLGAIRRWRCLGLGPRFVKISGPAKNATVRYRAEDVDAWLKACPGGGGTNVGTGSDSDVGGGSC